MPERGDRLLRSRKDKLKLLRKRGIDPFPPRYRRTCTTQAALALFDEIEQKQGSPDHTSSIAVAGRLTSFRGMGKATFIDITDGSGKIQALLRHDLLGEEYTLVKDLDMGDLVGVEGPLFRTRTGEITVESHKCTLLSKSLRPLPEKWHGLKDVEQRYRQRYLDLISNPQIKPVFLQRSRIIEAVRSFLNSRDFVEVDTPVLVPVAAGAMARPFSTHHHTLDEGLFLRIATELYLKRLVVGGFDKVYELGRVFRNEGVDQDHNPEFTLLESYEAYADYIDVLRMVEEMIPTVAQEVLGTTQVQFKDRNIELASPWKRITFSDAIHQYSGIDVNPYIHGKKPLQDLTAKARERGLDLGHSPTFKAFDKLFSLVVEPQLIQPTFVLDYPLDMSPLAKQKEEDKALVERFEGFAGGMEIANSFTELNDPDEQRKRLLRQEEWRQQFDEEEADRTDKDFLLALEYGMPPTGGLGIGIDRLVMLLTGQISIRDVLLFPQMRSKD